MALKMNFPFINSLKLLYDTTIHQRSAECCHKHIDNKGKTITIIKRENVFSILLSYIYLAY